MRSKVYNFYLFRLVIFPTTWAVTWRWKGCKYGYFWKNP